MTKTEDKHIKVPHMMWVVSWDNFALWEGCPPVVGLAYTYPGPHNWPQWASAAMGKVVGNVNVRTTIGPIP